MASPERSCALLRLLMREWTPLLGDAEPLSTATTGYMCAMARALVPLSAEAKLGFGPYEATALALQYVQRLCQKRQGALCVDVLLDRRSEQKRQGALCVDVLLDRRLATGCVVLALKVNGCLPADGHRNLIFGEGGPTGAYEGLSASDRSVRPLWPSPEPEPEAEPEPESPRA